MRNPFSKQGKTVGDGGCCAPLTFEDEPPGDQQSSGGCCAPSAEDQLAADVPRAEAGAELPARDREPLASESSLQASHRMTTR